MANLHAFSKIVVPLATLTILSCGGADNSQSQTLPHTAHVFGEWHREKDRHYRTCTLCEEIEEGEHEDSVCDICAEFRVLALGFIEGGDPAHADFSLEANEWFPKMGKELGFTYDFSTDFGLLNEETLENYELVLFLDNLPYDQSQRDAFENFMEEGGAWMGFHVSAFTTQAEEWDWYHENFLGSGNFYSNTWNPTAEVLKVETHDHPSTALLPDTILSSPNEWYSWEHDLRENPDIQILLSLDDSIPESSFPIGDRNGEMWYEGYYPVAWSNRNYNMIYLNMGHNLMSYNDYEKTSRTFSSEEENDFILDGMFGITAHR